MIFILAAGFVLVTTFAVLANPDIFSPAKVFLFFFLLFHLGAIPEISVLAGSLILLVLLAALWAAVLEARRATRMAVDPQVASPRRLPLQGRDYTYFLWLISLPPIAAQLYMIQQFGGLEGYVNSIGLRVVEWSGYGWARMLIVLIIPINLVYFALGLRSKKPWIWWSIYAAHLLIVLGMGALSGSRSSLLNVFLMQLIVYHYIYARIQMWRAASAAVGLTLAAMALGVLRNTIRYGAEGLTTSGDSGSLSFAAFSYGVEPIEVITTTEYMPLAEGSTFLSLITNAIPREIWPDKPQTGGVFFTQNYLGDAWQGYSNLTPTFIGEWIINFGWAVGIVGYLLSYGALIALCVNLYFRVRRKVNQIHSAVAAVDLVIYVHVLLSIVGLMVGEVTSVILTLILSQLLPLLAIRQFFRWTAPPEPTPVLPHRNYASGPVRPGGPMAPSGGHYL